jgi:lipopolysaccharide/colanic/teichoic acid biosynthesis glycosyltransferase
MNSSRTQLFWHWAQRVLAALMLVALSPCLLILFALVKATSRGPALYSQERPGLGGKPFRVWKIRTMRPGSDRDASKARGVRSSDPQVTAIGRILRQLKIDEFPQLWNIVRGEMAFVGPRPIAKSLYEELCREIPGFEQRVSVHPGLTNVGQVCIDENADQNRVIEDWKLRFEAERHYLRSHSPFYDLIVIAMTVLYIGRKLLKAGPKLRWPRWNNAAATVSGPQSRTA